MKTGMMIKSSLAKSLLETLDGYRIPEKVIDDLEKGLLRNAVYGIKNVLVHGKKKVFNRRQKVRLDGGHWQKLRQFASGNESGQVEVAERRKHNSGSQGKLNFSQGQPDLFSQPPENTSGQAAQIAPTGNTARLPLHAKNRAVCDAVHKAMKYLRNLKWHEEVVLIGQDGSAGEPIVGEATEYDAYGNASTTVSLCDAYERGELKGKILVHNHPAGTCRFTVQDMSLLVRGELKGMYAVMPNGDYVYLEKQDNGNGKKLFEDMYEQVYGDWRQEKLYQSSWLYMEQNGIKITNENGWHTEEIIVNTWLRENAERYGYSFIEWRSK